MEQFQKAYLRAVTAAAGCNVVEYDVDEGVDALVTYQAGGFSPGQKTLLDIQLKSTTKPLGVNSRVISVKLDKKRFDELSSTNVGVPKIVVIMSLPKSPQDWVKASPSNFLMHHCCYWVSIAGRTSSAAKPTVSAPLSQVFDDRSLLNIMDKLSKGLSI
ncbi:DUF4365 domain-containing protein [Micrococcus luteus]|nr:DUF4365 domain-containing protein [Micrococcus luteus]